jgi:hypothetical protein
MKYLAAWRQIKCPKNGTEGCLLPTLLLYDRFGSLGVRLGRLVGLSQSRLELRSLRDVFSSESVGAALVSSASMLSWRSSEELVASCSLCVWAVGLCILFAHSVLRASSEGLVAAQVASSEGLVASCSVFG